MSNNQQEGYVHPLQRTAETILHVDIKQLQDEALVNCMKAEIEALNEKTKEMRKNREELEKSDESMKKNIKLSKENYYATLSSIQLKQKLRTSLKKLVDKTRGELDAYTKRCDETHEHFTRQYEKVKSFRESVTPQYAEYQKARAVAFESQIRRKEMQKKVEELTEKVKLRRKVDSALSNAEIVIFAQAAVNYYKRRDAESNNPVETHEERVSLHATVPTLAEIEIPIPNLTIPSTQIYLSVPSTSHESHESELSKLSLRFEESMKQFIQQNPCFAQSSYLPKVQSPKRPLSVSDENPNKKVTIISVHKIRDNSLPPQTSPSKETELGSKSSVSIIPFAEPPKISKTTDSEFSEAVGGVTSVFFEKPKLQTREMVVPPMDNLLPSPVSVDGDVNSYSFDDQDQYMPMMSPVNNSNSNVDMAMSPMAVNSGSVSNIQPQFMFNSNQPTVGQQPDQPMPFFPNTASSLFNLFSN